MAILLSEVDRKLFCRREVVLSIFITLDLRTESPPFA